MHWPTLVLSLCSVLFISTTYCPAAPKKVLLIGQGPDGHPAGTHEYVAGIDILAKCLKQLPDLQVMVVRADGPWKEGPELLKRVDAVVLYVSEGAKWIDSDPQRGQAFADLAARGGGIVGLHWAIGTREAKPIDNFLKLLGGCHGGPDRKYKVVEAEVQVSDARHPITLGINPFRVREEFYYRLKFVKPENSIQPVLRVSIDGETHTVAWAWVRPDGGRSFGFSGLHFHDNWRRQEYRRLVVQAVLWTLKLPIAREGVPVDIAEDDLKLKEK